MGQSLDMKHLGKVLGGVCTRNKIGVLVRNGGWFSEMYIYKNKSDGIVTRDGAIYLQLISTLSPIESQCRRTCQDAPGCLAASFASCLVERPRRLRRKAQFRTCPQR